MTAKVRKVLDGCDTQGYKRCALDVSWKSHMSIQGALETYKEWRVNDKIRQRRLQFAGHCLRSSGQFIRSCALETNAWQTMCREACYDLCWSVSQEIGQTPAELKTAWRIDVSGEPSLISDRCRLSEWVVQGIENSVHYHSILQRLGTDCGVHRSYIAARCRRLLSSMEHSHTARDSRSNSHLKFGYL